MDYIDVLSDTLSTFYNATNISVTLLGKKGDIIQSFGVEQTYCQLFHDATGKYCPCSQTHQQACLQAVSLGESYIFSCPAGLIQFSVPVMKAGKHIASIIAGPISLEYPDMSLVDSVMQKHDIAMNYRSKMYSALSAIPLVEPYRARYLSKLLFLLVSNQFSDEHSQLDERSGKTVQQAKIGEYMQIIKGNPSSAPSQFEHEKLLISDVLLGDVESARSRLNEMLGRIYFTSGNNIEIIKVRTIELITILSRALIESGEDAEVVYPMTEEYLGSIAKIDNLTDLSYVLMETLEKYTTLAFANVTENNLTLIRKSVHYINQRYNTNLTLENVAAFIGLNPTYFSILFKKEIGVNFSHYINKLRIEQAKHLLKTSSMPLVAIAEETGFESQSYFSKVFKKLTGTTPKQFRETL